MSETVKYWEDQLACAKLWRNRMVDTAAWNRYISYWEHEWNYKDMKSGSVLPINLVYEIGSTMLSNLIFENMRVVVTPRKPGYELEAKVLESIPTWLYDRIKFPNIIEDAALSAYLFGFGAFMVGYDTQYGFSEKHLGSELAGSTLLGYNKKTGDALEYSDYVTASMPWVQHIESNNVLWPAGTIDAAQARWVAIRYYRPLQDVKDDNRYSAKPSSGSYLETLSGNIIDARIVRDSAFNNRPDDISNEWCELWQIHDRKTGKFYILCSGFDKFLMVADDVLQINGRLPVYQIVFNKSKRHCYGVSDVKYLEPEQHELNDARTQGQRHRAAAVLKFLVQKNSISGEDLTNFTSNKVASIVEVAGNPQQIIMPINTSIPQDLNHWSEIIKNDAKNMIGISDNMAGNFQGKTHISATETGYVASGGARRMNMRRIKVTEAVRQATIAIYSIIFNYWTQDLIQQIVGPDGSQLWIEYQGPQLYSDYNVRVDIIDSVTNSPEKQRADIKDLLALLKGTGNAIPPSLVRQAVSYYDGINAEQVMIELQQAQGLNDTIALADAKTRYMSARQKGVPNAPSGPQMQQQ